MGSVVEIKDGQVSMLQKLTHNGDTGSLVHRRKMTSNNNKMSLQILSPQASLQRRTLEATDFKSRKNVPLQGHRVLTVFEHSLVKIDLLAALPRLCQHILRTIQMQSEDERKLRGKGVQLEWKDILGPNCIRALFRLMAAQMAWKESKWGKIPRNSDGRSSRRALLLQLLQLQKHVSDKLDFHLDHNLDLTLDLDLDLDNHLQADEGRAGEDKTNNNPRTTYPTYGLKSYTTSNIPRTASQQQQQQHQQPHDAASPPQSTLTLITQTQDQRQGDKKRTRQLRAKHSQKDAQGEGGDTHEDKEKEKKKQRRQRLISFLDKDVSTFTFLTDLLNMASQLENNNSANDNTAETRDSMGNLSENPNPSQSMITSPAYYANVTGIENPEEQVDALKDDRKKEESQTRSSRSNQLKESESERVKDEKHEKTNSAIDSPITQDETHHPPVSSVWDTQGKGGERQRSHHRRHVQILQLIRRALQSKYEDHVRKALRDKDSKALICMLSLLPTSVHHPNEEESSQPSHSPIIDTYYSESDRSNSNERPQSTSNMDQPAPPALYRTPDASPPPVFSTAAAAVGSAPHSDSSNIYPKANEPSFPLSNAPSSSPSSSSSSSESSDSAQKERERERRKRKLRRRQVTSYYRPYEPIIAEEAEGSKESGSRDEEDDDDRSDDDEGSVSVGSDDSYRSDIWDAIERDKGIEDDPNVLQLDLDLMTKDANFEASVDIPPPLELLPSSLKGSHHHINIPGSSLLPFPNSGSSSYPRTNNEIESETTSTSTSMSTCTNMFSWTSQKSTTATNTTSSGNTKSDETDEEPVCDNSEASWEMTNLQSQYLQLKAPSTELLAITEEEGSMMEEEGRSSSSGLRRDRGSRDRSRSINNQQRHFIPTQGEEYLDGVGLKDAAEIDNEGLSDTPSQLQFQNFLENELRTCYQQVLSLLLQNPNAVKWIKQTFMDDTRKSNGEAGPLQVELSCGFETGFENTSNGFKSFQMLLKGLKELMRDRLGRNPSQDLLRERTLKERWKNEQRHLQQLSLLKTEMRELERKHMPQMLTLDFQIRILNSRLRKMSKENFQDIRQVIRDLELNEEIKIKCEMISLSKVENSLLERENEKESLKNYYILEDRKFRQIRDNLKENLREEIQRYDDKLFELQDTLDDFTEDTGVYEGKVKDMRKKYADVNSRYVDMKAELKLKSILKRTQEADEQRRHRAAKLIQDTWRKYKIRKRKRERRKGKKGGKKKGGGGGKKKADAGGKGTRDSESPESRSQSKSRQVSQVKSKGSSSMGSLGSEAAKTNGSRK